MWELLMMAVPFAGLHFGQITLQVPRDGLRPQLPDDPTDIPGGPNLIGVESYVTLLRRCCMFCLWFGEEMCYGKKCVGEEMVLTARMPEQHMCISVC